MEPQLTTENPSPTGTLPPLLSERLLIEQLAAARESSSPSWSGTHAIVTSPGRGQSAQWIREQLGFENVQAWYLDLHDAGMAREALPESVEVLCAADLPEQECDLAAISVLRRSESELTRDILQQAHLRLRDGGHLIASVDNPRDRWLHEQMQGMFDKVTSHRLDQGCVYVAKKTRPLKKAKDFRCQFPFRDEDGRLIQAFTRPGVFSHRRLDAGARQLMLSAEIGPQDSILEMGCGCGAVAMCSSYQTSGKVYAVDSNARSIECTRLGIAENEIKNVEAIWDCDGSFSLPGQVDLALANPPYFGDEAIWRHFVDVSVRCLRPGGALLVVTKKPRWYSDYFQDLLEDIVVFESGKYFIACGRRP